MSEFERYLSDHNFKQVSPINLNDNFVVFNLELKDGERPYGYLGLVEQKDGCFDYNNISVWQPLFPFSIEVSASDEFTYILQEKRRILLCSSIVLSDQPNQIILHGFNSTSNKDIQHWFIDRQRNDSYQVYDSVEQKFTFIEFMDLIRRWEDNHTLFYEYIRGCRLKTELALPEPVNSSAGAPNIAPFEEGNGIMNDLSKSKYEMAVRSTGDIEAIDAGDAEVLDMLSGTTAAPNIAPFEDSDDFGLSELSDSQKEIVESMEEDDIIDVVYRELGDVPPSDDRPYPILLAAGDGSMFVTESLKGLKPGTEVVVLQPVYTCELQNLIDENGESVEDFIVKNRGEFYSAGTAHITRFTIFTLDKRFPKQLFNATQPPVLTKFNAYKVKLTGNELVRGGLSKKSILVRKSLVGVEPIDATYCIDGVEYKVPAKYILEAVEPFHGVCVSSQTGLYGAVLPDFNGHMWNVLGIFIECCMAVESEKGAVKLRKRLLEACEDFSIDLGMEWLPQYKIMPVTAIINYINSLEGKPGILQKFVRVLQNVGLVVKGAKENPEILDSLSSCIEYLDEQTCAPADTPIIGVELYTHKFSDAISECIPAIMADSTLAHQVLFELLILLRHEDEVIENIISLHDLNIPPAEQYKTVDKLSLYS